MNQEQIDKDEFIMILEWLIEGIELETVSPADNNPLESNDGPFAPSSKDVHENPF